MSKQFLGNKMELESFKNFDHEYDLLLESFTEGIYVKDLINYLNSSGSLKDFVFLSPSGDTFKFSKQFLKELEIILTTNDLDPELPLFSIDFSKNQFKISRKQKDLFNFSIPEIKKLDKQFFNFGEGSLKNAKGSNKGDLIEIIFNFVIYTYLLNMGNESKLQEKTLDIIYDCNLENDSYVFIQDTINNYEQSKVNISLIVEFKNKLLLDYLKDPKNKSELVPFMKECIKFITNNKHSQWETIVNNLNNKIYNNSTLISIKSLGKLDSKLDKTDISITVKEQNKNTENILLSLKNKNSTFARIELNTLKSIKSNLLYLGVNLGEKENEVENNISLMKKDKDNFKNYVDDISKIIYDTIFKQFNKFSNEDKVLYFIIHPSQFFIKGTDTTIHDSSFTILDFSKNVLSTVKPLSKLNIKKNVDIICKDLELKFIFSSRLNIVNNLILYYQQKPVLNFRYSTRGIGTIQPRAQIYVEVAKIPLLEEILNLLAES